MRVFVLMIALLISAPALATWGDRTEADADARATSNATGVGVGISGSRSNSDSTAVGINDNSNRNTNLNGAVAEGGDATARAKQGQAQGQIQSTESGASSDNQVVVEGDSQVDSSYQDNSSNYEEAAQQAAPVYAGLCSSGGSAQFRNFGLSRASTAVFCQRMELVNLLFEIGEDDRAYAQVAAIERELSADADWKNFRRFITAGLLD